MRMRDWELIGNVYGEERRELKWIESYMVEKGCDRLFFQSILSFPNFKMSLFREAVSLLLENAKSDEEHDWLFDNKIIMEEEIESCTKEYFQLLDTPIIRLVNDLAVLNWKLFIKPKLPFTLWVRDNNERSQYWFARQWTLSYWELDENCNHSRVLWAISTEWTIPSWHSFDLSVNIGGIENVVMFHLGLLLVNVFLHIEEAPNFIEKRIPKTERELSFKIHDNTIWIYLFADADCWRSGDWRRIVIHPLDILLGRDICTTQLIEEKAVEIHFDNRIYKAKAKLEIRTWTRSRFPFLKKSRKDVGLEIENGIPIPGKGENSYDIEDDALMGTGASTFNLATPWDELVAQAIQNAINSVQETRLRYGGEGWESFAQKVARETGLEVIES